MLGRNLSEPGQQVLGYIRELSMHKGGNGLGSCEHTHTETGRAASRPFELVRAHIMVLHVVVFVSHVQVDGGTEHAVLWRIERDGGLQASRRAEVWRRPQKVGVERAQPEPL